MIELAQEFDVHPDKITQWRDQLLEGATGVFGEAPKAEPEPTIDVRPPHVKIGELTLENDFLSAALGKAGLAERKNLIDPIAKLEGAVLTQRNLLMLSR